MQVAATLKNLRIAPRKVRLIAELIKGLDIEAARDQLATTVKRGNPYLEKLLMSAVANGENNLGLDRNNLYIFNVVVKAGPTLKRWMPKAYGRAGEILKRTSSVTVVLEERIEGKGRKSKEQLEKEKKERMEAKKKAEKEARAKTEKQKAERESDKKEAAVVKSTENKDVKKAEKKGGLTSRIFRRKSM